MSSLIVTTLVILLAPSIALSFSTQYTVSPPVAQSRSQPSLIHRVCHNSSRKIDSALCAKILQSDIRVVSARNLFDLSVAIMQTGESYSTTIRTYLDKVANRSGPGSNEKAAFQQCISSYDLVVSSFRSALSEVVKDHDYQTATYDLLLGSTDYIQQCSNAVALKNITDRNIWEGNKVVTVCGLSAYEAVNGL